VASQTRERIVAATASLFQRQGFTGSGLKQISAESGAPFGSVYHFFPGGKEELAEEVLRTGGAFFLGLYEVIAEEAPDLVTGLRAFFDGAAQTLRDTDYADACPIGTVAGEIASTHERLRVASSDVFDSWIEALASRSAAAGIEPRRARELAESTVAILEGAFLLSRARRDTAPMATARDTIAEVIERELERARG
jgi:AcrR family transcriptional regulator